MSSPPLLAYTLFCDDVRREVNGKFSAIGVYQGILGIEAASQTLARLTVLTVLELPPEHWGATATLKFYDGETELTSATVKMIQPHSPEEGVSDRQMLMNMPLEASPFEAKDGMRLWIEFRTGDFYYRSSELSVVEMSPDTQEIVNTELEALPSLMPKVDGA